MCVCVCVQLIDVHSRVGTPLLEKIRVSFSLHFSLSVLFSTLSPHPSVRQWQVAAPSLPPPSPLLLSLLPVFSLCPVKQSAKALRVNFLLRGAIWYSFGRARHCEFFKHLKLSGGAGIYLQGRGCRARAYIHTDRTEPAGTAGYMARITCIHIDSVSTVYGFRVQTFQMKYDLIVFAVLQGRTEQRWNWTQHKVTD